jgi:hypothetical protein
MNRPLGLADFWAGIALLPRASQARPRIVAAPEAADPLPARYDAHARSTRAASPPAERPLEGEWLRQTANRDMTAAAVTALALSAVVEATHPADPTVRPACPSAARLYRVVAESANTEGSGLVLDLYA